MIDVIYVVTTIAFFVLMLLYVVGCNRLGHMADAERARDEGAPR